MDERNIFREAEALSNAEPIPKTVVFLDILSLSVLCLTSVALAVVVFAGSAAPLEALWGLGMIGVLALHFWDNCWLNAEKWRSKRRLEIFDKLMRERDASRTQ